MSSQPIIHLSPEEYLELERQAEFKSEYIDGVMYQMSGGSEAHNLIAGNLITELNICLRKTSCKVYPSDMKVRVPSGKNISTDLLPTLEGIKLIFLTSTEIAEKAEADGSYVYYLEFAEFKVEDQKVVVTLRYQPKYAKRPRKMAFGGSLQLEWRREGGRWRLHEMVRMIV
jgi:hypothetical protein